ncbi:MAG: hypothetical protein L0Z53_00450 [Acidobacteriales bacterium]|nr:hypothetical protein [Terriglobales bacterium]
MPLPRGVHAFTRVELVTLIVAILAVGLVCLGQIDFQEFLAGTNPTSDSSILRVITVNLSGGDTKQVLWSAVAGRTYLAQYKDELADPWSTLQGTVRAVSSTAVKSDLAAASQRFYRVLLVE